jgi:hypothetical protein
VALVMHGACLSVIEALQRSGREALST